MSPTSALKLSRHHTVLQKLLLFFSAFISLVAFSGASLANEEITPGETTTTVADHQHSAKDFLGSRKLTSVPHALFDYLNSSPLNVRGGTEKQLFHQLAGSVVLIFSDSATGSGAVISSKGIILTNWHVVENADVVSIVYRPRKINSALQSPKVARGKVAYTDKFRDLAIIELLDDLPSDVSPMTFGSAPGLSIGQDVHAIGHPFGEYWTYTRGYISQIRENYSWSYEASIHGANVIQTQTPINPGNSGGPLFDNNGKLIGLNSFVLNEAEGINFAVSISEIENFLADAENGFYTPVSSQDCDGPRLWEGRNLHDTSNLVEYDRDCDGIADYFWLRPDDPNEPITAYLDDDQNGVPEGWVRDFDRDGKWDSSYWDTNGDGKPEIEGIHELGGILPVAFKAI